MNRNLSINQYFYELTLRHKPRFRFSGSTLFDFQQWHKELFPEVKESLGKLPKEFPCPPIAAQWNEDGLIKQRIIFDVEEVPPWGQDFGFYESASRLRILACSSH